MEIRKGPYGHFVCEKIESDIAINSHSIEMIDKGIPGIYLPVYVYEFQTFNELSYDFSGLSSINSLSDFDVNQMRNAIGNLFLSIQKSLDLLLPLGNIHLNRDYIFWDKDNSKIYLCYSPIDKSLSLRLSDLNYQSIEALLSNYIFKSSLTNDERNQILFAIKNNDEQLFIKTANLIKEPITEEKKANRFSEISSILIMALLLALSYFIVGLIPSIILFICFIFIKVFLYTKTHKSNLEQPDEIDLHETRKQILFNSDTSETNADFNCMFIESLDKVNGEFIKSAIYTSKATIGSDYFLSDICINSNAVAPLNAEITLRNNIYNIKNISERNNITIEGVAVKNDKEYELKNGQTITIGGIKLLIKIGFK